MGPASVYLVVALSSLLLCCQVRALRLTKASVQHASDGGVLAIPGLGGTSTAGGLAVGNWLASSVRTQQPCTVSLQPAYVACGSGHNNQPHKHRHAGVLRSGRAAANSSLYL